MAGAAFSTGPVMVGGVPKPPGQVKQKATGARLTTGPQAVLKINPPVTKPQVAPPPTSKPVTSATTTQAPQSPLDSTYYNNLAANQLKVNNQVNSINAAQQTSTQNLQNALAQLAYQQPRDQLATEQAANNRGALYSSVEGQQQGNLVNQYQTKQSADVQANASRQASLAAQIAAINQSTPLYQSEQYDAAVARAAKAAAANPATGQAAIPPPTPTATLSAQASVAKSQAAQKAALAKAVAAAQKKGKSTLVMTGAKGR